MKKTLTIILSIVMIVTTITALPFSARAESAVTSYLVTFTPNENFPGWETVNFTCWGGSDAWADTMTLSGGSYTITINPDFIPTGFLLDNKNGTYSNDSVFKADGSEINVTLSSKTIGTCTITEGAETALINEGFENGIPDDWTTENSNPSNTYWKADRAGDYVQETGSHSGNKNAYTVHVANSDYSYLITPAVNLSKANSANLSFWYINRDWSGDIDKLEVFYRVNGGAWTALFNMADGESTSNWTKWSNKLPPAALADNVQFGFKYTDKYGYGVGLDDVKLTATGEFVADYYDGELGAIYTPESTTFNYWAPDATNVNLSIVMNADQPMQKLMDGTQWTGVWTITLAGNYLNYRYYFVVDGVNKTDPYGKANNAYYGTTVTSSVATNPYGWNSDSHVFFDDGESVGMMSFVDVGSFLSDDTAGVQMAHYGKYLALAEEGSSVYNAGNVLTGNGFLRYYSDIYSICIDIASSDNPMLPKKEYAYDIYTEGASVNEVKQMIQALHNIGIAVNLSLDFTSAPFTGDMLTKYIVDTCTYWANEYHIDGFVLKEMISPEAEAALKSALDEIDTRFFLAGTSTYRLRSENALSGIATMPQTGSNIPNQIRSLMTDKTSLYTHEAGNMDDLMLTIAAMSRGRMTLNFGQEFGGYGNPVDWSKLGNSYNYETEKPVFEHTYSYFRQLMEIRKQFAPLYSAKGTHQASTSGNTVVCTYTNDAQRTDEWQKMKVLINLNTNERSFTNSENWVVIAKSGTNDGTVDYKNGLEVINGTNVSVAAKSAVIMVDKASFDELNAPPPVSYNINIGGTDITSANANDVFGDGTVKYNDETKTLTLNNFTYEGAGIHFDNAGSEMTLELIGTNTIKETSGANGSTALLFKGSLKVTGSGTLNAIVCDATGDSVGIAVQEHLTVPEEFTGVINATSGNGSGSAFVHGIFCWGEAVISGGTINATGGTGQRTYGMECGSLTVNGGTVNATGGNTTDRAISGSYGIAANMSFTVNGGTVTARSGRTANRDYCWSNGLNAITIRINGGVVDASSDFATSGSIAVNFDKEYGSITIADGIFATASENNDGSGAVAYNKNENASYKWFKSEPVHIHNPSYVPEVQATTEKSGHTAYYECTECHKIFTDADAKNEITDATSIVIPKVKVDSKLNVDSTSIYTICSIKNKSLTVNWKKVKNATNYEIEYRKAGASKWTTKTTSGKNSYVIKGLSVNGLYEFRLRTVVIKGKQKSVSPWSNTSRRYIYQAKQTKLTAGKGAVTTTWSKDKNATSYEIQIATDKDFTKNVKKVTAKKSETKKTIKGLKKKNKYYVRIRAVKKYKDKNYIGQWSNAKSATTKK